MKKILLFLPLFLSTGLFCANAGSDVDSGEEWELVPTAAEQEAKKARYAAEKEACQKALVVFTDVLAKNPVDQQTVQNLGKILPELVKYYPKGQAKTLRGVNDGIRILNSSEDVTVKISSLQRWASDANNIINLRQ